MRRYRLLTAVFALLLVVWLAFGNRVLDALLGEDETIMPLEDVAPQDAGLDGALFYSQGREGVWRLDLTTGERSVWWQPETTADGVLGLAVSPDGSRIVISVAPDLQEGAILGPSELYISPTDSPDLRPFVMREAELVELRDPVWSPDGQWVYYTHYRLNASGSVAGFTLTIDRMAADGTGEPETVIVDGQQPALSPDGSQIAYIAFDRDDFLNPLVIANADGSNRLELVYGALFESLASPRFTPDGTAVLFAASGLPGAESAWWDVGSARAHGAGWDIWRVPVAGGEPVQVTRASVDGPWLAWSPDGSRLAFVALEGVFVLNEGMSRLLRLAPSTAEGQIGWAP
jgi:Tol biopolymer transport system component